MDRPVVRPNASPLEWTPIADPDGLFSSGISDLDRQLGGGFRRGSLVVFDLAPGVGRDDLDLLLFPAYLNFLYHSRGVLAILPSNDSPHDFRERLTRHVTRRRFDSRVRVMDYVGEDEGLAYVVNFPSRGFDPHPTKTSRAKMDRAVALAVAAEAAAQGHRRRPYLELTAFEIFDMLMGSEKAARTFFHGVKRARQLGNLVVGLLGPGLGCADAVRRMADQEFELRRDEVGLQIRGIRPAFPAHLVTEDRSAGRPHVVLVPRPG